ncbi:DUF6232 family protein, partial [Actinoplanes sp. NPDC004185]
GVRMSGREYRLGDFAQVWHRQGRRSWSAVAGRGALGIAMIVPLVIGAVGVLVALVINASTATTVALIGGGILIGLAAAPLSDVLLEFVDRSYDKGSRRREIWARIRGSEVLLLDTDNAQRFGQIYRALQRALDHDTVAH